MVKKHKREVILCLTLLLLALCYALSIYAQPYKSGKELRGLKDYSEVSATSSLTFYINDVPVTIDAYQTEVSYDVPWLTCEEETTIRMGDFVGYELTVQGQSLGSGESMTIRLNELSADQPIAITTVETRYDIVRTNYLRTLPQVLTDMKAVYTTENSKNSYLFSKGDYLVKMDSSGNVLYYRLSSQPCDFRSVSDGENDRYVFLEYTGQQEFSGNHMYKGVLMDSHYQVLDIVDGFEDQKGLVANGFEYLSDYHYIIASEQAAWVNNLPAAVPHDLNGVRVIENIVQEIQNGESLWVWKSTEESELYENSTFGNDFYNTEVLFADYVHISDLELSPQGDEVLCTMKHQEAVLCIPRTNPATADICYLDTEAYQPWSISKSGNGEYLVLGTDNSSYLTAMIFGQDMRLLHLGHQKANTKGCVAAYDGVGGYVISWGDSLNGRGFTAFNEDGIVFELLFPQLDADTWINGISVAGRG